LFTVLGAVEAIKIAFFKKKQPIIGNAYADAQSACCACFRNKYAWPENSGMPATTANAHTCNTCYVSDRYGIEATPGERFRSHNQSAQHWLKLLLSQQSPGHANSTVMSLLQVLNANLPSPMSQLVHSLKNGPMRELVLATRPSQMRNSSKAWTQQEV